MRRGRTPAHALARSTTSKREGTSHRACSGRQEGWVRIIQCGGTRSGGRTRGDQIRFRSTTRRPTSSGGVQSQRGLTNLREEDQKDEVTEKSDKAKASCSRKVGVRYLNASESTKLFVGHVHHECCCSRSSFHPKRATSLDLLRSGSFCSDSRAFARICCVCSEFQSSRKAASWLVVVTADFLTCANICALLVCGLTSGDTSVGTVERSVSSYREVSRFVCWPWVGCGAPEFADARGARETLREIRLYPPYFRVF